MLKINKNLSRNSTLIYKDASIKVNDSIFCADKQKTGRKKEYRKRSIAIQKLAGSLPL